MRSVSNRASGKSDNWQIYRRSFCCHAHELLWRGYARLQHALHAASEETDITGELVQSMQDVLQDPKAPAWMVHYALRDDPPLNVPGRTGKRRPRVDIEFERVQRGPRPIFRFEAKRLDRSHPVSDYVGSDGLGCFLTGRYPLTHDEAGMLGYVQSDDETQWADRIKTKMESAAGNTYALRPDGPWRATTVVPGMSHTYSTRHNRKHPLSPITVWHVFLRFC